MRKKFLRSLTIITILAITFSATALAISFVQQANKQQQEAKGAKRKTLREIAQERDVEHAAHLEIGAGSSDFRQLAKASDVILIGQIIEIESSFTESGDFIQTDYSVEVRQIFKNTTALLASSQSWQMLHPNTLPAQITSPLKIKFFGGVLNINNHRAAFNAKGLKFLQKNKDYIFFLGGWGESNMGFMLTGGIEGTVLVENNQRIKTYSSDDKAKHKYDGIDVQTFITEVLDTQP